MIDGVNFDEKNTVIDFVGIVESTALHSRADEHPAHGTKKYSVLDVAVTCIWCHKKSTRIITMETTPTYGQ